MTKKQQNKYIRPTMFGYVSRDKRECCLHFNIDNTVYLPITVSNKKVSK